MKKRRFTEEQIVRMLRTTVSGGGTESDGRMFVFGNYLDEVLVMGYRFSTSWIDFYYGHDHLYSPTVLCGSTGIAVERYEYDAYGSVQILTSAFYPPASSQYGNPYTFTGRELDTMDNNTLHLMYYRARTYDPETGRFMQRDPLGINPAGRSINFFEPTEQYADGYGLQVYAQSDPVNRRDNWGLTTIIEYRNPGTFGHAGLLVDGRDIDYGPLSLIINKWVYEGISPWEKSDGGNSDFGPSATAEKYELKMKKAGLMWAGPKAGTKCCNLNLRNAAICVKYVSQQWNGTFYSLGVNDCRAFVKDAKYKCCLTR